MAVVAWARKLPKAVAIVGAVALLAAWLTLQQLFATGSIPVVAPGDLGSQGSKAGARAPAAAAGERNTTTSGSTSSKPPDCPPGFDRVADDCFYACRTNLPVLPVAEAARKGICLDDTTFEDCSDQIPYLWPHTQERITSIRIFSPWKPKWPAWKRDAAWRGLMKFVRANSAKVLVGVEHTCDDRVNDAEWEVAKQFLQMLGPESVMGVAIGNEMELLHLKGAAYTSDECQERLWKHRGFWNAFVQRVTDLDRLPGFERVPVTSVMGAFSLIGTRIKPNGKRRTPFIEKKYARLNTFVKDVTERFGRRYAFTFNFYPYFDPSFTPDPWSGGETCWNLLHGVHCLGTNCMVPNQAVAARVKAQEITGRPDDTLWIGETGWSYPKSSTMKTAMATCVEWSSRRTFKLYYERFLSWDLSVEGVRPPDHIFYFTIRDSINFGQTENFGLISSCASASCKLQMAPGCYTAWEPGECNKHVTWAKEHGIYEHPEWYPGLRAKSSFADFQEHLFRNGHASCPEPC